MRTDLLVAFLSGALVIGYAVAALFFLRFWRDTRDRLFGYFATSFFLLAVQRLIIATTEATSPAYIVRLLAFVLIIWAVVDKNRSR